MSRRQALFGIFALAIARLVFAQTTETKTPNAGGGAATTSQLPATLPHDPCATGSNATDQAEILTDTMGVDFGPYLSQVVKTVRLNWYNVMPPSVYPPILKQGKLSIEFFVLKDGKVSGMQIYKPSGDIALDRAAWASVTASNPLPPLPAEFHGERVGLRFSYYYNFEVTRIIISPCIDIQVPAGSTLQFLASGKGNASVTWSVSGPGCSKSACGTISDTGLYVAPINIPAPSTVFVHALSRSDMSLPGIVKLAVVKANPSP